MFSIISNYKRLFLFCLVSKVTLGGAEYSRNPEQYREEFNKIEKNKTLLGLLEDYMSDLKIDKEEYDDVIKRATLDQKILTEETKAKLKEFLSMSIESSFVDTAPTAEAPASIAEAPAPTAEAPAPTAEAPEKKQEIKSVKFDLSKVEKNSEESLKNSKMLVNAKGLNVRDVNGNVVDTYNTGKEVTLTGNVKKLNDIMFVEIEGGNYVAMKYLVKKVVEATSVTAAVSPEVSTVTSPDALLAESPAATPARTSAVEVEKNINEIIINLNINQEKLEYALTHLEEGAEPKQGNAASFEIGTYTYNIDGKEVTKTITLKLLLGKKYLELDGTRIFNDIDVQVEGKSDINEKLKKLVDTYQKELNEKARDDTKIDNKKLYFEELGLSEEYIVKLKEYGYDVSGKIENGEGTNKKITYLINLLGSSNKLIYNKTDNKLFSEKSGEININNSLFQTLEDLSLQYKISGLNDTRKESKVKKFFGGISKMFK